MSPPSSGKRHSSPETTICRPVGRLGVFGVVFSSMPSILRPIVYFLEGEKEPRNAMEHANTSPRNRSPFTQSSTLGGWARANLHFSTPLVFFGGERRESRAKRSSFALRSAASGVMCCSMSRGMDCLATRSSSSAPRARPRAKLRASESSGREMNSGSNGVGFYFAKTAVDPPKQDTHVTVTTCIIVYPCVWVGAFSWDIISNRITSTQNRNPLNVRL